MILPRLPESEFTWFKWTGGKISDLGIACRKEVIVQNKQILLKYAIGWCEGKRLSCRPKRNEIALMVRKDDVEFWFHLRKDEFNLVFNDMRPVLKGEVLGAGSR